MLRLGIKTGHDLRRMDKDTLVAHFGKTGLFLYDIVRGIDERPVEPTRERKSIGSETTLCCDTNDTNEIHTILSHLAEQIEYSLKKKQTGGYTITLKVRYQDFTTITRSQTVQSPHLFQWWYPLTGAGITGYDQRGFRKSPSAWPFHLKTYR